MARIVEEEPRLLADVIRLKEQLDAIDRALLADGSCIEVLKLTATARRSIGELIVAVAEKEIRAKISGIGKGEDRASDAAALVMLLKRHMR
jgi:DNA-binding FrmR family transcriptional regulator